jgi:hypothetical protein
VTERLSDWTLAGAALSTWCMSLAIPWSGSLSSDSSENWNPRSSTGEFDGNRLVFCYYLSLERSSHWSPITIFTLRNEATSTIAKPKYFEILFPYRKMGNWTYQPCRGRTNTSLVGRHSRCSEWAAPIEHVINRIHTFQGQTTDRRCFVY